MARSRAGPTSSAGRPPERVARVEPLPADRVLALQRSLGNQRVAELLSRPSGRVLSRRLDVFPAAGVATDEQRDVCEHFGEIVSDLVDEVHGDLSAGRIAGWKGAHLAAFLKLLRDRHPTAVTHAASVVEERVYTRMFETDMPAPWEAQFVKGMGAASKPDIVIHLDDGHIGLIDVTSDRGHILWKAGGWLTGKTYVYVAEAWFPSITADHLPRIRTAIETGGIGDEELAAMQADVKLQRRLRAAQRKRETDAARARFNKHGNMTAFARAEFGGNKTAASDWLRTHGVAVKGMTKRKRKPGLTWEQKRKKQREAAKRKRELTRAEQLEEKAAQVAVRQRGDRGDIVKSLRALPEDDTGVPALDDDADLSGPDEDDVDLDGDVELADRADDDEDAEPFEFEFGESGEDDELDTS